MSRGTFLESSQNETSENGLKMTLQRSQKVRKTTYDRDFILHTYASISTQFIPAQKELGH